MKTRLLAALFATAMLGGCATYDYTSGSAPGGYYHGRPSVEYYGPYHGGYGYGYPSYGTYGSYISGSYRFGSPYYRSPYYRGPYGYYPRYGHNPHYRPPRPRPDDHQGRPPRGDRPPPWRAPDGRYRETGSVLVPPTARGNPPPASGQPAMRHRGNPGGVARGQPMRPSGQVRSYSPRQARPGAQAAPAPAPARQSGAPWRAPQQSRPEPIRRGPEREVRQVD